ncbi:MAG: MFS transporter, partial [Candidatus Hydrogenedentota bacterium]
MNDRRKAVTVLTLNTLAFTVCFAVWMMNGVLITFLVENGVFTWSKSQIGWLIGIPVLTGSLVRLPVGVLTDKYGGRIVYTGVLLVSAFATYLASYANSYNEFLLAGLGFGLSGTAFAVGIAYTSVWFRKEHQGTALGIFGIGNAGAAFTSMAAPSILKYLTQNGANLEGWRNLPRLYAAALAVTAVVFYFLTYDRTVSNGAGRSLSERLAPLKIVRVWRFGLYYFFVFGGYVALSQWMIPYYVSAYQMSIATAGLLAATFSLPSGVIRALGGWMSDRWGARSIMYWVLGVSLVCCVLLFAPRMDIMTPG